MNKATCIQLWNCIDELLGQELSWVILWYVCIFIYFHSQYCNLASWECVISCFVWLQGHDCSWFSYCFTNVGFFSFLLFKYLRILSTGKFGLESLVLMPITNYLTCLTNRYYTSIYIHKHTHTYMYIFPHSCKLEREEKKSLKCLFCSQSWKTFN